MHQSFFKEGYLGPFDLPSRANGHLLSCWDLFLKGSVWRVCYVRRYEASQDLLGVVRNDKIMPEFHEKSHPDQADMFPERRRPRLSPDCYEDAPPTGCQCTKRKEHSWAGDNFIKQKMRRFLIINFGFVFGHKSGGLSNALACAVNVNHKALPHIDCDSAEDFNTSIPSLLDE